MPLPLALSVTLNRVARYPMGQIGVTRTEAPTRQTRVGASLGMPRCWVHPHVSHPRATFRRKGQGQSPSREFHTPAEVDHIERANEPTSARDSLPSSPRSSLPLLTY